MKERIIDIAIQQMKGGGYANLNFANIAAELNTSRANLHHHFKNKEGLAIAATETYIQKQKAIMDDIFRNNDGDITKILENIENYMIEVVSESESYNACICSQLIHESEAPGKLRQLALNRFQEEEEDVESQIKISKEAGTLNDSIDVKKLTFSIVAAMHGIGQMALIESDKTKLIKNIKGSLVSILE